MAFLGGWIAWRLGNTTIVRPTADILDAAGQIQAGRLDVRVPLRSGISSEFARIAEGLNQMADSLEQRVIRAFAGRFDPSRVEAMLLRPIAVTGGVKTASVLLADPTSSVQTLIARAGGSVRAGGDYRVYLLRPGLPAREVSTADRISDLGVRSSDQLYLQDPPFVVRNEVSIRSIFEALQLTIGALTVYYLIRRG